MKVNPQNDVMQALIEACVENGNVDVLKSTRNQLKIDKIKLEIQNSNNIKKFDLSDFDVLISLFDLAISKLEGKQ